MKRTAVATMKANAPASRALNGRRPRVFGPGDTGTGVFVVAVAVVVVVVIPGVGVAGAVWTTALLPAGADEVVDRV
jgi:hypothetical protein